jgi:uncharacterized membrane protein
VVSKAVMAVIPPYLLLTLRLLLGILTLSLVIIFSGGIKVTRRQFWQIFWVGFVGYGVSVGLQFVGTNLSTASNGSLVTSATPAFVLIFAALLLGEKITGRRLVALLVASLGVVAVIDPRTASYLVRSFPGEPGAGRRGADLGLVLRAGPQSDPRPGRAAGQLDRLCRRAAGQHPAGDVGSQRPGDRTGDARRDRGRAVHRHSFRPRWRCTCGIAPLPSWMPASLRSRSLPSRSLEPSWGPSFSMKKSRRSLSSAAC